MFKNTHVEPKIPKITVIFWADLQLCFHLGIFTLATGGASPSHERLLVLPPFDTEVESSQSRLNCSKYLIEPPCLHKGDVMMSPCILESSCIILLLLLFPLNTYS